MYSVTRETKKILDDMPHLLELERVWHIGTLDLTQKKPDSHEGCGLAVSLHPQAWRQIATLEGAVFRFEKKKGFFADMHACLRSSRLMQRVWIWAQAEQYVRWQLLYCVTYNDKESEQKQFFSFMDEDQALAEYEALRHEKVDAYYEKRSGYAPTERMRVEMIHTTPPLSFVQDFAVFLFLEKCFSQLEGVCCWIASGQKCSLLQVKAPVGRVPSQKGS